MSFVRAALLLSVFMIATSAQAARTLLLERYASTPKPQDLSNAEEIEKFASTKCQIYDDGVVVEHKAGTLWTSRTQTQRFDVKAIRTLLVEARKQQVEPPEMDPEQLVVTYHGRLQEGGSDEQINLLYNRSPQADTLVRFIDMNCGAIPPLK